MSDILEKTNVAVKRYTNWCAVSHGHQLGEDERGLYIRAADYDALAAAARKVTCRKCWGLGYVGDYEGRSPSIPCPDCADLRKLLEGER